MEAYNPLVHIVFYLPYWDSLTSHILLYNGVILFPRILDIRHYAFSTAALIQYFLQGIILHNQQSSSSLQKSRVGS